MDGRESVGRRAVCAMLSAPARARVVDRPEVGRGALPVAADLRPRRRALHLRGRVDGVAGPRGEAADGCKQTDY